MSDFYVKRIIMPSGKSVEVVYFDISAKSSRPQANLHICTQCNSSNVYPIGWNEVNDEMWEIDSRCPDCEHQEKALHYHEDVEAWDALLNSNMDLLIDDLEFVQRSNMEEYIDGFTEALFSDHILPEDF